jgi:hypothetical protein
MEGRVKEGEGERMMRMMKMMKINEGKGQGEPWDVVKREMR